MTTRIFVAALLACLLAVAGFGQAGKGKSHVFKGKVEAVNESAKTLTVNGEKVEGWMDAMTMAYTVDKAEVLKTVKVGDQIQATVFDGDYTLHDVKVVAGNTKGGGAKKK